MWALIGLIIMPAISLLSGVISLYIDPEKEPRKKWILVAVLLLSACGSVAGGVSDDHDKDRFQTKVDQQGDTLSNQSVTLKNMSAKLSDVSDSQEKILAKLESGGVEKSTVETIRQSLSAAKERQEMLPSVLSTQASNKVTVEYFPKRVDGPVVVQALKEGGFNVVENEHGNAANAALPTNEIVFGELVQPDQARFVALTLVRAGVGIKKIHRGITNHPELHQNVIEVISGRSLIGQPALTVEEIDKLQL